MKNTKALVLLMILFFSAVSVIKLDSAVTYGFNKEALQTVKNDVPDNFEDLLDEEYGVSEYGISDGKIKISIVKTVTEKHFVKYSWVNYDISSFTAYIFIEAVGGEDLKYDEFATAIISDKNGFKSTPFYSELSAWPQDDPLRGKMLLTVRFAPLKTNEKTLVFTVFYDGKKYMIENVNFT